LQISSEDVIRVAEKLADVERRLAHIEASLDGSAPVAPPDASSSGRPRTRQPPVEYLQGEKPR